MLGLETYHNPLQYHYILSTNLTPIIAEGVLSDLHSGDFDAVTIKAEKGIVELATVPNGTRVLIDVSDDLWSFSDVATSTKELLEEWVTEGKINPQELPLIRRLITVRHLDHADKSAIATIVSHLCAISDGRLLG